MRQHKFFQGNSFLKFNNMKYIPIILLLASCSKGKVYEDKALLRFNQPNAARMYFNTCNNGEIAFLRDDKIIEGEYYWIQFTKDDCVSLLNYSETTNVCK
jgi:hypothetical protein